MRTKAKDRGWRDWYQLQRWRNRAKHQLREHPLCKFCLEAGKVVPATIADHVREHEGNVNEFWLGPLQSLCAGCHARTKRIQHERGYKLGIDADGYWIDPRHPSNRP